MDEHKIIISQLIKKQMEMVGPAIALSIAKKVPTIKVADNGEVLEVSGDSKAALEQLANAYIEFSGEISKLILKSLLS